jgi:hypothetical protein
MKKKLLIFALFVFASLAGSLYVSHVSHSTHQAKAAPQKVKGYLWSDNTGWVSLSCENAGPCGVNTYQVTVDSTTGMLSGMGWSNHLGWLDFGAGCPSGIDPSTCNAKIVGSNLIGWAKFTTASTATWHGWVSFSSLNDTDPGNTGVQTSGPTYGPVLSGNSLTGHAWGSTGTGWLEFVGVTIDGLVGAPNLELRASLTPLTASNAPTAPNPLTVPNGTSSIHLNWWKNPGAPVYTGCVFSSTGTNANGPLTWPAFAPPELPPNSPATYQYSFSGTSKTYTLTCTIQGGGTDVAVATVNAQNLGPNCNVLTFGFTGSLCPPGSAGYSGPAEIAWSTSSNTVSCSGTPNGWMNDPLNNNNTSGAENVSSYSSGTTFNLSCTGSNGASCNPSSGITLNYLSANDPTCSVTTPTSFTQCNDGVDNNDPEDTLADAADPGCHTDGDATNPASYNPNDTSERNTQGKVIEN